MRLPLRRMWHRRKSEHVGCTRWSGGRGVREWFLAFGSKAYGRTRKWDQEVIFAATDDLHRMALVLVARGKAPIFSKLLPAWWMRSSCGWGISAVVMTTARHVGSCCGLRGSDATAY